MVIAITPLFTWPQKPLFSRHLTKFRDACFLLITFRVPSQIVANNSKSTHSSKLTSSYDSYMFCEQIIIVSGNDCVLGAMPLPEPMLLSVIEIEPPWPNVNQLPNK